MPSQFGWSPEGWLQLLVLDERFVHNEKAGEPVEFTRQPNRYLADGYLKRGGVAICGSLNLGEPRRAKAEPETPEDSAVAGTGYTVYGSLGAEYDEGGWGDSVGGRLAAARFDQSEQPRRGSRTDLGFKRD